MITEEKSTIETSKGYAEFEKIKEAIEAFCQGQFLVVSDDEDRENEGDLIIAAEHISPEAINFMITHARGLVCVAITQQTADKFGLSPMVQHNTDHNGTAFTVSVDATIQYGVTTGISASDRAKTIQLLVDESSPIGCMQSPGHVFPLVAKSGGVLQRPGHTEAGVDLARLAGLAPVAVIVEIIKSDGSMARRTDLLAFAKEHQLHYITIENLRKYILARTEALHLAQEEETISA